MAISKYELTEKGRKKVHDYLEELKLQRKIALDAGLDTAEDTNLPTEDEILEALLDFGFDEDGETFDSWGITDHYDSDGAIMLTRGLDIVEKIEAVRGVNIIPVYANLLEDDLYGDAYGDIYTSYEECKAEHPDQKVKYGYYADIDDGPDIFDTIDDAEDYIKGIDLQEREV